MITALNIVMIVLLIWIFYEDLKNREITTYVMIGLLFIGGFLNFREHIFKIFLISTVINILVISWVVFILWLYAKFELKSNLFKVFGIGDVLFFIFMGVSFPTSTFLVIFSCSLIFSLMISLTFRKKLTKMVPLAGMQALFLVLIVGINLIFELVNLYTF